MTAKKTARPPRRDAPPPTRGASRDADPRMVEAFARFKAGTRVADLARDLDVKRGALRRAFRILAGGDEAYRSIMASFAPVVPPGRTRTTDDGTVTNRPDDSNVPVMMHAKKSDGWATELFWNPEIDGQDYVHIAPDGIKYIRARWHEAADMIIAHDTPGLPDTRLRKLEGSWVERRLQEHAKTKVAIEKSTEARKEKKKSIRKARKAKKSTKAPITAIKPTKKTRKLT